MRHSMIRFAIPMLCIGAASCASDPNPLDWNTPSTSPADVASFNLSFGVAGSETTRADGDATGVASESQISKVDIFVFDAEGKMEKSVTDQEVEGYRLKSPIRCTPGVKTVYAVARSGVVRVAEESGLTISDFEKITFDSDVSRIAAVGTGSSFAMIGKSLPVPLVKNDENSASDNNLSVTMTRVAAKAQLKVPADLSYDGIRLTSPKYQVMQTANKMEVVNQGKKSAYGTAVNGTYSDYTLNGLTAVDAVAEFDNGKDCQYISENIVDKAVSGNTTFISVEFTAVPEKLYSYSGGVMSDASSVGSDFYAVARTKDETAMNSYVTEANHVLLFESNTSAQAYMEDKYGDDSDYKVVEFKGGKVYYRINLKHGDAYKVVRNTFYKVAVSDIQGLGNEKTVIPTGADTDISLTDAYLTATFSVADWDVVTQDVTLK